MVSGYRSQLFERFTGPQSLQGMQKEKDGGYLDLTVVTFLQFFFPKRKKKAKQSMTFLWLIETYKGHFHACISQYTHTVTPNIAVYQSRQGVGNISTPGAAFLIDWAPKTNGDGKERIEREDFFFFFFRFKKRDEVLVAPIVAPTHFLCI
ncbi:hypothetical protein PPERSA_04386 [Pseudocohnilembus persalinus]|uniref:Uncharacterized protein n=1 Tax=Pseudocohnilembus persalinus TaxID=266149 RepID=A0A0V0QQN1_PSEPJ|nr:hypothetical protein PPERSA_04386 [Pseudocohnilembus persalinus]|eukprot:KRX04571.1 hypothetical protein PPERSA_04386 [Pseudocohnilembus persalinus]